jgi:23S rRNA (guanosine2251-2'-O)-methyltransferase
VTNKPFIVFGRIPVLESLRAGKRRARRLFLLAGAKGFEELRAAAEGIPIAEHSRLELDEMAEGANHQGVLLETNPPPVQELNHWLRGEIASDAMLVVLDGVEDPRNFGAIVRSAAACGAAAVVFGKDRAAPVSPVAAKAAAGAMEHVPLVQVTNIVRALDALKEAGFWVAGLDAEAETLLWDANLTGRVALVVGSEGHGMRRLVSEHCDFRMRIPLAGPITSLNASISAAIALAECLRRRHAKT